MSYVRFCEMSAGRSDYLRGSRAGLSAFWSSSPYGSNAWFRGLYSGYDYVYRFSGYLRYGFSVRCVRD